MVAPVDKRTYLNGSSSSAIIEAAFRNLSVETLASNASSELSVVKRKRKEKLGAQALKRVAAGAHLPTPWLFERWSRLLSGLQFPPLVQVPGTRLYSRVEVLYIKNEAAMASSYISYAREK